MGKVWFIADMHFGHTKIIEYCDRPYSNAEEMDEDIVETINSYVHNRDRLYILGDVSFRRLDETVRILRRINGQKYLIQGNHDHHCKKQAFKDEFVWIRSAANVKVGDDLFVLLHYPMLSWDRMAHGSIHLHGHCHGGLDPSFSTPRRFDVGWDIKQAPFLSEDISGVASVAEAIWGSAKMVDYHKRHTVSNESNSTEE